MTAHSHALKRKKRGLTLEKDKVLRHYVHAKLKAGWSPYQIEGRLKLENNNRCIISHESIYQYIYSDAGRCNLLHKYLRRKHRCRMKQGQRKTRMPKEILIAARPENINDRSEFGHWECDLMIFKKSFKSNLITLRERKSRYVIAIKNQNREASGTALALISTIRKIKESIKSITFDQGSEFMRYDWIKDILDTQIYFCDPASPYQKGSVENANGVLRTTLPRSIDIDELKQKEVSRLSKEINDRPLKCLNYRTPAELFNLFKSDEHEI